MIEMKTKILTKFFKASTIQNAQNGDENFMKKNLAKSIEILKKYFCIEVVAFGT